MPDSDADSRYSRQIGLPEIGRSGQDRLAAAHVVVAGAGGLGSAVLLALTGSGIGRITLYDPDRVSLGNLNRQYLYQFNDIGMQKTTCASRVLLGIRPDLNLTARAEPVTCSALIHHEADADILISAVDNNPARAVMNQAACLLGIPLVDGAVDGFNGRLSLVRPGQTPCLACFNPECIPPSDKTLRDTACQEYSPDQSADLSAARRRSVQVLAPVPAVIGHMQATACLLVLLGLEDPLKGQVLYFHGKSLDWQRLDVKRDPLCPVCSRRSDPETKRIATSNQKVINQEMQ